MSKRVLDIVASSILAALAAPAILAMAIASGLWFGAWPFFTQTRVGKDGRHFRFVKIRTLPVSTHQYADKYALDNVKTPRLAQILRNKHLDELPQLFHVLSGKMSLVGPRPEMPGLHDAGDPIFAAARTSVRPGCAGLWQVSEDQAGLIWESPAYDLAYLRHVSVGFDLWILMRTVLFMLHLRPAVAMADVPKRFLPHGGLAAARIHLLDLNAAEERMRRDAAQLLPNVASA